MTIEIEPTKIKQSFYLLIPKNIANLINIQDSTKLTLNVKNTETGQVLEYRLVQYYKQTRNFFS